MAFPASTSLLYLVTVRDSEETTSTPATSGFYADNDLEQTTERVGALPSRQRREIKQEILTLLGLHHRPKPYFPVEESSAPRYMLDLYNVLQNGKTESDASDHYDGVDPRMNLTTLHAQVAIKEADLVMSFVNHGKVEKCLILKGTRIIAFEGRQKCVVNLWRPRIRT